MNVISGKRSLRVKISFVSQTTCEIERAECTQW